MAILTEPQHTASQNISHPSSPAECVRHVPDPKPRRTHSLWGYTPFYKVPPSIATMHTIYFAITNHINLLRTSTYTVGYTYFTHAAGPHNQDHPGVGHLSCPETGHVKATLSV
jgi:hypothetical protein